MYSFSIFMEANDCTFWANTTKLQFKIWDEYVHCHLALFMNKQFYSHPLFAIISCQNYPCKTAHSVWGMLPPKSNRFQLNGDIKFGTHLFLGLHHVPGSAKSDWSKYRATRQMKRFNGINRGSSGLSWKKKLQIGFIDFD
jgi:hypothetical protein